LESKGLNKNKILATQFPFFRNIVVNVAIVLAMLHVDQKFALKRHNWIIHMYCKTVLVSDISIRVSDSRNFAHLCSSGRRQGSARETTPPAMCDFSDDGRYSNISAAAGITRILQLSSSCQGRGYGLSGQAIRSVRAGSMDHPSQFTSVSAGLSYRYSYITSQCNTSKIL
jgi:hypothetical protein